MRLFHMLVILTLLATLLSCHYNTGYGGNMEKEKNLKSGKTSLGIRIDRDKLLDENEKIMFDIASQKALEIGFDVQNSEVYLEKNNDQAKINIIDPKKLPPPGSLGGSGAIQVQFKRDGGKYIFEEINVWE